MADFWPLTSSSVHCDDVHLPARVSPRSIWHQATPSLGAVAAHDPRILSLQISGETAVAHATFLLIDRGPSSICPSVHPSICPIDRSTQRPSSYRFFPRYLTLRNFEMSHGAISREAGYLLSDIVRPISSALSFCFLPLFFFSSERRRFLARRLLILRKSPFLLCKGDAKGIKIKFVHILSHYTATCITCIARKISQSARLYHAKAAAGTQWRCLLCFVPSSRYMDKDGTECSYVVYAPHLAQFYLRAMTLIIEFQGYSPRRLAEWNFPLDDSTNFSSSSKQDETSCFIYYSFAFEKRILNN